VTDSRIYAVSSGKPLPVHRSRVSWTARSALPDTNLPFVYVVAGNGLRGSLQATAALFSASTDNGGLWSLTGGGLPKNRFSNIYQTIFCFAEKDSLLLVGTVAGVFGSTDKGITWGSLNDGLDASPRSARFLQSGRNVFAVGGGGYYITHSPDNGATMGAVGLTTVHYHFGFTCLE